MIEVATRSPAAGATDLQTRRLVPIKVVLLACAAVGLASLLVPSTITYDPFTWANWARQIVHGQLHTRTGPAWKPLPVAYDLLFAPFGRTVLWAWLALARAGGVLAVVMAYRLAKRYGGTGAGLLAGAGVVTSTSFAFYLMAVGMSEPLLAGLALLAIERHLDGHRPQAAALLYACVMLRPELLVFYLGYGWYLARRHPRAIPWLVASVLAVPLLLFLPDYLSSGDWMRSSERAAIPSEGGPLLTSFPAWAVVQSAARAVIFPVLVGDLAAVAWVWRSWRAGATDRPLLALILLAAANILLEAGITQLHKSAGDERYLIVGYTLMCVVSGVGASRLVAAAATVSRRHGRLAAAGVALFSAVFVVLEVQDWPDRVPGMLYQVHKDGQLQSVLNRLGRQPILSCGQVLADTYQGAALAWYLDVPISRITVVPRVLMSAARYRGTLFTTSTFGGADPVVPELSNPGPFHVVAVTSQWEVLSTCPSD